MEICTKYWCFSSSEVHFYMKNTVFAPSPSSNLRLSIENSKICKISKSTLLLLLLLEHIYKKRINIKNISMRFTWRKKKQSKILKYRKPDMMQGFGTYFEIFWLWIPITQNPVFRQLVPFDMLSHICTIVTFYLK